MRISRVSTSLCDLAVAESDGIGPALLLLHGNSSCKEVFTPQFECPLAGELRLIAIDLPGHGASANAPDPKAAYALSGYSCAMAEALTKLGVMRAAVFGWSLGGHIAIDMISKFPGIAGVMVSGTPPVPPGVEGLTLGFAPSPDFALASKPDWTDADAEAFARAAIGPNARFDPFMLEAAKRCDPATRRVFFAGVLAGEVDDQRRIAETSAVPLAIVNGAQDPFLNHGYFEALHYANLWDGRVHRLAGVGHAPFWEAPEQFNPLLERFVAETA